MDTDEESPDWKNMISPIVSGVTPEEMQREFRLSPKEAIVALLAGSRNTSDEIARLFSNSSLNRAGFAGGSKP